MSAREMFEKLGYKKFQYGTYNYIKHYKSGRELFICFDTRRKKVSKGKCGFGIYPMTKKDIEITMRELQAINQQVKELKWLDE